MLQSDTHIDKPAANAADGRTPDRNSTLKRLASLITELNIARKNRLAYPPGHIQLVRSLERALAKMTPVLEQMPELTFEVKRDRLVCCDATVNTGNPAVGDYANALHRFGVHSVTFFHGLDAEELERFHQLLAMDPAPIWDTGGVQCFFNEVGFEYIRIREIDYHAYRVTEDVGGTEKADPPAATDKSAAVGFLKRLFSKIRNAGGGDVPDVDKTPAEVARWLNEGRVDAGEALASYDQFLSEQIAASGGETGGASRNAAIVDDLNALLKNLKPGLRRQFLAVTFNRLADVDGSGIQDEVLGGLSDEMVIEMLRHANEANQEISPALVRLVQKMSWARGLGAEDFSEQDRQAGSADGAASISVDDMKQLFEPEKYEQYVDSEYDSMLKRLSGNGGAENNATRVFNLKQLLRTFREEYIDHKLNALLLPILDNEEDPEIYRTFSQNVVSEVPKLLDRGDFKFLLKIFAMFNCHISENPVQEIRFLAERSLGILQTPRFLNRAAAAFEKWSGEKGFEISDLYLAIGTRRISRLIDIYGRNAYRGDVDALLSVLAGFGPVVLDDVYSRLEDSRSEYVLNMIHLIGAIGNRQSLTHLKSLLSHGDPVVRFAALEVFLKFKDPEGIKALRRALQSTTAEEFALSASLAGDYRVVGLVPDLLAMVKIKPRRKSDFDTNAIVIRALGKIGHISALPTLEKLVFLKWSLYPQRLAQLKEVVYESLERYPYENIRGLIASGEKSANNRIQRLCAELIGRQFHSEFV